MHFHSPLDFSLEADAASHRGALASPSTLVAEAVLALGFSSFDGLGRHLAALPYGRVVRSGDPLAVLREVSRHRRHRTRPGHRQAHLRQPRRLGPSPK